MTGPGREKMYFSAVENGINCKDVININKSTKFVDKYTL